MNASELMSGRSLFVWEINALGEPQNLIKQAKRTGIETLIIKAADGAIVWPQFAKYAKAFKDAGLRVVAWSYIYAVNLPQAAQALCAAVDVGADGLVIDAEVEFEKVGKGATLARELCQLIRDKAKNIPIGYTSFGLPNLHSLFPYQEFSVGTDFVMPQLYFADSGYPPDLMLQQSVEQLVKYHKPIIPVGQAYGQVTPQQVDTFLTSALSHRLSGVSWWSAQAMTGPVDRALTDSPIYQPLASTPITPTRYSVWTGYFPTQKDASMAAADIKNHFGWNSIVEEGKPQ